MTTKLEYWRNRWRQCQACELHKNAHTHVLYRGQVPADVLLVGEAPGKTENDLGKPFVGVSGQLLSRMLREVGIRSYLITNTVCCMPINDRGELRAPNGLEIDTCSPHVFELLTLCHPKLFVAVGSIARDAYPEREIKKHKLPHNAAAPHYLHIVHPAYILRQGGENSLEYKRTLSALRSAMTMAGMNIAHTTPLPFERPTVVGMD